MIPTNCAEILAVSIFQAHSNLMSSIEGIISLFISFVNITNPYMTRVPQKIQF